MSRDRSSWSLLAASALVSIAVNGIHAWLTQSTWIAVDVALTPGVSAVGHAPDREARSAGGFLK
ncbi:hypothetical protein HQO24_24235 [Rhodococcus fascians]|nr:hypothetical protein [Rhodococcus fascians]MBY4385082.1 hypothetical protein [Rhodococcus fascians]MBY4399606.1 hypothetical protein [Rhodococcus fascians]MBY4409412.1 hypothetical protein [Rhodococcus fascians]MBY4424186.1 hypothetical protein [Rhodococcus fascians]